MASWLMRSSPDRAVLVGTRELNVRVTLRWTSILSRGSLRVGSRWSTSESGVAARRKSRFDFPLRCSRV